MIATVSAPANIAFLKYWGARDLHSATPLHASLSMTLETARATTTLEWREGDASPDDVQIIGGDGVPAPAPPSFALRVRTHLGRMRERCGRHGSFRVATSNNFPTGAGIASSAAGFAALAFGAARLWDVPADGGELSLMARLSGSGSAARSVAGGFVRWPADPSDPRGPAIPVAPADHWDLRDVIAIVDGSPKEHSSLEGHRLAPTSPHFSRRLQLIDGRRAEMERAIADRSFEALAPLVEEEAIELHLIAMSSRPPLFYWKPGTLRVLEAVRSMRARGLPAAATIDAGANVHVICEAAAGEEAAAELERLAEVAMLLRDRVGSGPRLEAGP